MSAALGALVLVALLVQAVRAGTSMARRLGSLAFLPASVAVVLGLAAAAVAEGLSALGALGYRGVAFAAAALLGASALLGPPRRRPRLAAPPQAVTAGGAEGRLAAALLASLAAVTFVLALASPPNTADALTYHLPPILHWLEQGSVAHYPTSIERQLESPPLAAYLRLPLLALTRSDALFGLVQWTFYVLAVAQSAGLAWLATRDARLAWRAAALCGSLPMAVLQASSTQNDLVVTAYALGAAAGLTAIAREPGTRAAPRMVWTGVCLGLAALTKGTGLILAVLLAPVLVWVALRRDPRRVARASAAAAALGLAALLAAPPLVRNARTFGQALPQAVRVPKDAWADARGLSRAVVQVTRGVLVQFQPILPRAPIGTALVAAHERMARLLRVDPGDPRLVWTGDLAFVRRTSPRHEDTAGNPLHVFLALWAVAIALFARRERMLLALLALGWGAFAALTVPIRFSPWLGRLQLPALALLAVPTALALGIGAPRQRRAVALTALLALASLPPLLANAMKPLVRRGPEPALTSLTRWENRFRSHPDLRPAIETVIARLPEGCTGGAAVGLRIGGQQPEYLLWAGAHHLGRDVRFVHLLVRGPSATCAVVTDRCPTEKLCLEGP